jgi:hypothetical protein
MLHAIAKARGDAPPFHSRTLVPAQLLAAHLQLAMRAGRHGRGNHCFGGVVPDALLRTWEYSAARGTDMHIPLPQGLLAPRAEQVAIIALVDDITGNIPAYHALWEIQGILHGKDTAEGKGARMETLQLRHMTIVSPLYATSLYTE